MRGRSMQSALYACGLERRSVIFRFEKSRGGAQAKLSVGEILAAGKSVSDTH